VRTIYENPPAACLAVPSGGSKVFGIPAPSRTRFVRVNVIQTDGSGEGFQIAFYNKQVTDAEVLPGDELYRFTAKTVGASGALVDFFPDFDVYFFPHDTPTMQGMLPRTVWLRIWNNGTGAHNYSVIVSAEDQS
jgi:hypothetical protein